MDKMRSVGPNRSSGPSHRDSPRGQPQAQTQTPPQRQKHSIFKPPPQNQHPPGQPYPSHSQRRLPQCSPVHLSHPVPLSPTSAPGPGQPRPPAPPPHRALPPPGQGHAHSHTQAPPRGASFRSEPPEHNSCRMVLDLEIPSPPQKPLPADPLGRNIQKPLSADQMSRNTQKPLPAYPLGRNSQKPLPANPNSPGRSGHLIRSPIAVGVPIPVPVPGVPRPLRPVPHHNRSIAKQPPTLPKPRMIVHAEFSS
ncbi:WAS/WASL-interacting protein family member 1-like [Oncorhynchus keta]|uniref:WAS/WASL-interacting protein family member 1-like n=1 Tax=Oncorhynchus keta TaxID=8018 RepID=UPI00227D4628|nr:WAS/WASL-interacting protein family member 1-like [Oncorhynchus keta]